MPVGTSFAALPNALITATQANASTISRAPSATERVDSACPFKAGSFNAVFRANGRLREAHWR